MCKQKQDSRFAYKTKKSGTLDIACKSINDI